MSYNIRVESAVEESKSSEGLIPNFVFEDENAQEVILVQTVQTATIQTVQTSSTNFLSVEKERIPRKITRKDSFFVHDDDA